MSEFIYVLENPFMPGLVKIGRTERSVSERASELSSHTGVPTGFTVAGEWAVADSAEAERTIHERLSDWRVSESREFFKIETEDALAIIESMLGVARPVVQRDYEREDELIARAIPIVARHGMAWPRLLEEQLDISYAEALFVINSLQGRGLLREGNLLLGGQTKEPELFIFRGEPNAVPPANGPRITPAAASAEPQAKPTEAEPKPDVGINGVPLGTKPKRKPKPLTVASTPMIGNYQLPPLDFLQRPDPTIQPTESKEQLMANARLLQETLAQFDIEVALGDITKGPTITRYELHAAPGVLLDDIPALSDNLATALKAERVHVLAPVPGKDTVGVEVPNPVRAHIVIRDMLECDTWRNAKARIPVLLGKDVYGNPIISDLSEMPHLLIAGGVGSERSVCLDAIIVSLLYRFSPDQLRFVMIDTTGVELQYVQPPAALSCASGH